MRLLVGMKLAYFSAMPSLPRYAILFDRSTFHVTWQCHNKDWLLESDWAKRLYYSLLLRFKERYRVQIYILLPDVKPSPFDGICGRL
jgi:hypothetical protein